MPLVAEAEVVLMGEDRDDDELDEFVLADERAGCVVVCLGALCGSAADRAAFVPHAW
jgi:hypothetical protein